MARWISTHSDRAYERAFLKLSAAGEAAAALMLEDDERAALAMSYRLLQERAQAEGSPGTGGVAIPVFIDPSLLVSDMESPDWYSAICRSVDVNTNAWKGVSSAGVSWSFDSEAAEVSDDSLSNLAQPTVTVYGARGFVPYSLEIAADWPGFQSEMARILSIEYAELLNDKFTRGNGSTEPKGILTALAAATPTVTVTSMTDGAFGQEDVYAVFAALPAKFRKNASWIMSVSAMNRVRQMGTYTQLHAVTVQLPAGAIDRLFERNVYENVYMPDVSTLTTGAQTRLVVGDFSNYVIARRTGMTVELVPMLFGGSGRPTGQRGYFGFARIGGNSVIDQSFRQQANT
jgi:HK97 family phage major capsid protein